jgi:hypothetical protein
MLGNLSIAHLNFIALCQQLAALSVPEPSVREPISSKTLSAGAVPLLIYDLLTTEREQYWEVGVANFSRLCFTRN